MADELMLVEKFWLGDLHFCKYLSYQAKAKKANVPFYGYFRRKERIEAKERGYHVLPKPAD
jgi:hypothetical protein